MFLGVVCFYLWDLIVDFCIRIFKIILRFKMLVKKEIYNIIFIVLIKCIK